MKNEICFMLANLCLCIGALSPVIFRTISKRHVSSEAAAIEMLNAYICVVSFIWMSFVAGR